MIETPLQFDFLLALFRPLLQLEEAGFLLDGISPRHVQNLLDEGELTGVNIAATLETRRELRVWRHSAVRLMEAKLRGKSMPRAEIVPVERIFTHSRQVLLKREVSDLLACTERHVENLSLPAGSLSLGSMDRCQRYSRAGLVTFLTERAIIA